MVIICYIAVSTEIEIDGRYWRWLRDARHREITRVRLTLSFAPPPPGLLVGGNRTLSTPGPPEPPPPRTRYLSCLLVYGTRRCYLAPPGSSHFVCTSLRRGVGGLGSEQSRSLGTLQSLKPLVNLLPSRHSIYPKFSSQHSKKTPSKLLHFS